MNTLERFQRLSPAIVALLATSTLGLASAHADEIAPAPIVAPTPEPAPAPPVAPTPPPPVAPAPPPPVASAPPPLLAPAPPLPVAPPVPSVAYPDETAAPSAAPSQYGASATLRSVAPAAASPVERFGRPGQLILTQRFGFVSSAGNTTTIRLTPAFDWFVTNVLTLGFEVAYGGDLTSSTSGSGENRTTTTHLRSALGVGGHIGLNVAFSDSVSLWTVLIGGTTYQESAPNTASSSLAFSLLLHPAPHFFVGLGPEFTAVRDIQGRDTSVTTSKSLGTLLGGWW
jgi:hypothetical protein